MRRLNPLITLVVLVCLAVAAPRAAAQTAKQVTTREAAELVIEGSVRGLTRGALVNQQIKTSQANWKRLFNKEPDFHETANFLLLGGVTGKELKDVGATLEKQLAAARKALSLEREDPWAGKLAVYLFAERGHYNTFVRGVEKRRVEEDELGCFEVVKSEVPHVAASPGVIALDPGVDGQAGEQMAAAALAHKVGSLTVPEWVLTGFGRATVFQAATSPQLSAEHGRARVLIAQKKRTVRDVIGSTLGAEEATVLRASLIEYMAYSGRTMKFVPFVQGFRPTENVESPTTDMAFNAANLTADKLNEVWQKWAKIAK